MPVAAPALSSATARCWRAKAARRHARGDGRHRAHGRAARRGADESPARTWTPASTPAHGLRFARHAGLGGRFAVPTLNAISVDRARLARAGRAAGRGRARRRAGAQAYLDMGAQVSFTCAPYPARAAGAGRADRLGRVQRAVMYANSVLGRAQPSIRPDFLEVLAGSPAARPRPAAISTRRASPCCGCASRRQEGRGHRGFLRPGGLRRRAGRGAVCRWSA